MLKKKAQIVTVVLFILSICVISIYQTYPNPQVGFLDKNTDVKSQIFSKEDYSPIIKEEKQALGNISVISLNFNQKGFFNNSKKYPNLDDDLTSGALNMSFLGINFIETKNPAQVDNLDKEIQDSNRITVILNESINVVYDISIPNAEGYLVYGSRLFPCKLKQLWLTNESMSTQEVPNKDYSTDSFNFLVFDYLQYFGTTRNNFTMHLIWEYNLTVRDWVLYQDSEDMILVKYQQQEIKSLFYYNFSILGQKLTNLTVKKSSDNLDVKLKLNLPDKDDLYGHTLKVGPDNINNFLNTDNSINISTVADRKLVSLTFNANYTIEFINSVENTWAIDRLVKDTNIRERIYFPSLIGGPKHILLKYLMIHEDTITVDQVVSNSSLFSREVQYFDLNVSNVMEDFQKSLIFTQDAVKKLGLKIILPYLILGETDPVIIRYDASNDLIIRITDNINMPLVGVNIELYYYQKSYGTYISNDLNQKISPQFTDENGEIIIRNVPNGNYIVRIYDSSRLIKEATVSANNEINVVRTDEIHFPLIILIFLLISGIFVLLGLISYIQQKKRRNLK
ncbi:MAG: hypothetical protein ACFFBH_02860 [Promethearchaeota archaeon]